ncbi:hypothetical protein Tco_0884483 [Tanacetum coccineum]
MHNNIMAAGSKDIHQCFGPEDIHNWITFLRSNATSSSTRPSASTRHKFKEITKSVTPQSELVSEEDSDPDQAQRDKDMQKNLALLAKNKTEDTTPRYNNDNQSGQFGNQRTMTVAGTRETEAKASEQADWLVDTDEEIDEQELEAHYSFMAKIQEVLPEESVST